MPTTAFFAHRSGEIYLDAAPREVLDAIRAGSPLSVTDAGLRLTVFPQHIAGFYETTSANQTDAELSVTASGVVSHTRVRLRGTTDIF